MTFDLRWKYTQCLLQKLRPDADKEFIISTRYRGTMSVVSNLLLQRCMQMGAFTLWELVFCGPNRVLLVLGCICQSFRWCILFYCGQQCCALSALRICEAVDEASPRTITILGPLQCTSVYPDWEWTSCLWYHLHFLNTHTHNALDIVGAHQGKSDGLHLTDLHNKCIYWWIWHDNYPHEITMASFQKLMNAYSWAIVEVWKWEPGWNNCLSKMSHLQKHSISHLLGGNRIHQSPAIHRECLLWEQSTQALWGAGRGSTSM